MKTKKILFVIPTLSNGGAEKVISKISGCLTLKGYSVTILKNYHCSNEYNINENVEILSLYNDEEQYRKTGMLNRLKKLRKQIKVINPDQVICFLNHVCIYVFIALIFSKYRKKIIFTERNNPKYANKHEIKLKNFLQNFLKKNIVQNKGQYSLLNHKKKKRSFIIPNPIDDLYLNYKKTFNKEPIHIISIGRFVNQKDYPLAINAFNNVLKRYPNLIYHIYGKGEDKDKIEELIKSLNLEGKVILEGFTTDINKIYENADIYLMTSKFEGMPNALAESMATGIPCISTDCEFGPSDLIDNESMGILVKEHSVESVEKALIFMIENYDSYVARSTYVKEVMKERYSLEKITNEWIKVIER